MLQNATPLRKSAPWPPNISDEHVSCTAPATRNTPFQILFKCPTPAIVFENATKPSRFAHFLTRCRIPWACHAKRNLNVQKCSEPVSFSLFWLRNALRAETACTFSTSQLPRAVREWCVLYIWASKCAWRHNGMHFFGISTSKSGPNMVCFVHFDFDMCFALQQHALFRHLNFQKCSDIGVLCAFWLGNVLRAKTAHLFISHLARWLHTRRFSEPTFRPSGATNHWKHTGDFSTFSRTCIFFLLTLSPLWSSLFFSSFLWLFPPLLFHLSILSEVWLLNFLRSNDTSWYCSWCITKTEGFKVDLPV